MRFSNLSQEAAQLLWEKWKCIIREILDEFNEDVFHGNGKVHENAYFERLYLALETKNGCLYIFPMPGGEILLRVCRHKVDKEALNPKNTVAGTDQENIIGTIHLLTAVIEERYPPAELIMREYLAEGLRRLYKRHWMKR